MSGFDLTGADVAKHVGIVLFSEVEELDAIGPWQVLSTWTRYFPKTATGSCAYRGRADSCSAPTD
jgi:hypothetical protein